jgi:hypothetical protein
MMKKGMIVGAVAVALVLMGSMMIRTADAAPQITVYKSPACGCCNGWIEHLEDAGFEVQAVDTEDMATIKAANGIHSGLASCHTGLVDGYAVEGHVPADVLKRFLKEKPEMAGLAVPGMPIGSPGMEVPGQPAEQYQVLAFDPSGKAFVYEVVN